MGDGDCFEPAERADDLEGRVIEKADAVPENIAGRRDDQEGPLPDRELRHRPNAEEIRRHLAEGVEAADGELLRRQPFLSRLGDELPLVLADDATRRRIGALRILNATSLAEVLRHLGVSSCWTNGSHQRDDGLGR
jgi:hypothetical protein